MHSLPSTRATESPVRVKLASADRKLSPVAMEVYEGPGVRKLRPVPIRPYVVTTYVSIEATCPRGCAFRDNGCYVTAGFTASSNRRLDVNAEGMTGDEVIELEAHLLDRAFRGTRGRVSGRIPRDGGRCGRDGRDLRLHVGGDVSGTRGARRLAQTAARWTERGGGAIWTYTHRWRQILRERWGTISVLASVERRDQATLAISRGYVPAIVVSKFKDRRAYRSVHVPRGWRILPCPAETTEGVTCVTCRLCLDADALMERKLAIGFEAHGQQHDRVKRSLPVL